MERSRVDCPTAIDLCRGVAKSVKAPDFDSGMRGFESFLPSHTTTGRPRFSGSLPESFLRAQFYAYILMASE